MSDATPLPVIPAGALPALRLAATSALETKRQLVQVLSTGGATNWTNEAVHEIGRLLAATRLIQTRASALIAASVPQS